jgi:hypothetical protein
MTTHHVANSSEVNAKQQESPESAPVNSFARTATHDDKNVGERQDSSQPVKPDASLRLIISLGYEDENDK